MINLLQQTPCDAYLADLLVAFTGTTRLIEFKQANNKGRKEIEKHTMLSRWILGPPYEEISRAVHWLIETTPNGDNFTSRIVPYLDAYPPRQSQFEFWDYVEATAEEAVKDSGRFSPEDLTGYLREVASINGMGIKVPAVS